MHISNPEERIWLRKRIEEDENEIKFTKNGKEAILNKLIQAEGFEKFLATKYVGTKRFGLDGAESLIPALEQIIKIGFQSKTLPFPQSATNLPCSKFLSVCSQQTTVHTERSLIV